VGRSLETGRGSDISFLLDYIKKHRGLPDFAEGPGGKTGGDCIFAAGYGAGGAALLSLTGKPEFIAQNAALRGIITVESPPLSVLERADRVPVPAAPQDANWFRSLWTGILAWAAELEAEKITGVGTIPVPGVPSFFLVSDRVASPGNRDGRYAALLRIFHAATEPAILAAVPGAGFLDYSDIPEKYPLFSLIVPGARNDAWVQDEYIRGTAALMTNFAVSVLEGKAEESANSSSEDYPLTVVPPSIGPSSYQPPADGPFTDELPAVRLSSYQSAKFAEQPVLRRQVLPGIGIHIETGRTWNSLKNGDIL
jgi:hypothetical protein